MKKMPKAVSLMLLLFFCLSLIPIHSEAAENKLLIGLIPEMNIFKQRQRYKPLGEYITIKTGIEIKFTILSRYGNIIENFQNNKLDGAFFGSFTAAVAHMKLEAIPVARPVDLDNISTYQGYIFVRKDSNIRDVKDMKGKKMAFVEKATTAGYIFPLAYLAENGISSYKDFFREYYFTGSHDAAISAVFNKEADIGAAKHSIYEKMRNENQRIDKELVILARSPMVPANGLCVRKDLDVATIKKLKETLLNMHNDPEGQKILKKFGALRFAESNKKDFHAVLDLAAKAGVDIKNYNWRNE